MINFNLKHLSKNIGIVYHGIKDIIVKLNQDDGERGAEEKRENALKNFSHEEALSRTLRFDTKLKGSQGISGFSGTSYNGPGKVQNSKIDTNKLQRNFNNHDSN